MAATPPNRAATPEGSLGERARFHSAATRVTISGMRARLLFAFAIVLAPALGCSGGAGQKTGMSCKAPTDCYPGVDAGALQGTVVCLSLTNGYCSHTCTKDSDCCAVSGECTGGIKEVCAPLESNAQTYCFVSCDSADISATSGADGGADPNAYCASVAGVGFNCRSTGGGAANKRFCGP